MTMIDTGRISYSDKPDTLHLTQAGACRTAFNGVPAIAGTILLVGEDNPISAAPEHALFCAPDGCAGQRLQSKVFGLPRAEYLAIWRTNLCVGGWSAKVANDRAVELATDLTWSTIVMLGKKVQTAFSKACVFEATGEFDTRRLPRGGHPLVLIAIPHPSGRNPAYNRPAAIATARQLMREAAPELAWGTV